MSEAIDRELAWVQEQALAPRPLRLGCTTVSHNRLGFCAACVPRDNPHDLDLELLGWRLLALRDAEEAS
jgi:hypothetical protein